MTSPTQENCSLRAAQRASLANAHMDAEVELALEDPEYRQSLHEDAAVARADMVPYYDTLFARVSKREQERHIAQTSRLGFLCRVRAPARDLPRRP